MASKNIKGGKGWYNGIQDGIVICSSLWIFHTNLAPHTKDNSGKQLSLQALPAFIGAFIRLVYLFTSAICVTWL